MKHVLLFAALACWTLLSGCATTGGGAPIYLIRIEKGDTLAAIAQKYDTTWEKIASLNDLAPGEGTRPGTILRIAPGPGGLVAGADTASVKAPRLAKRPPVGKLSPDEDVTFTEDDIPSDDGKSAAKAPANRGGGKKKGLFFNGNDGAAATFFAWPVAGQISSPFGRRGRRAHEGVDIRAPYGQAIGAAGPGIVEFVGSKRGYGRTVIIRHGKWRTLYAHLSSVEVSQGDRVLRHATIGKIGTSGNAKGPHLHLEIHDTANKAVDPRPLMPAEGPLLLSVN